MSSSAAVPLSAPAPGRYAPLEVGGGLVLRTAFWPAAGAQPQGTVLILQGLAEFLEKYEQVAAALQRRGFDVCSFDWRGQGGSARRAVHPRLVHVDDFAEYLDDLAAVRAALWDGAPAPHYVLAHSMGGHLALRALSADPHLADGVVLSAPMLGVATRPWPRPLARRIARAAVRFGLRKRRVPGQDHDLRRARFEGNPYTSDAGQFARIATLMRAHPELVVAAPTLGWLDAAFRSLQALHAPGVAERIAPASTVALAAHERVVDNAAARRFAARLPAGELIELPGARHELLFERPAVLARLWQALDARFVPRARLGL